MSHTSAVLRAIDRARNVIKCFKHPGNSVDINGLAFSLGIQAIEPADMQQDGYLGRRHDGALIIRYRAQNGSVRNRFTVAHEIAHILLMEAQGVAIARQHGGLRDREEESAVNRIAAELLMPCGEVLSELVTREQKGHLPSWRTIHSLSRKYEVSPTAFALRVLELPGLHAVSLRINIEGCGAKFPFDRSEHTPIRLVNGIEYEMERLWREARQSTRHVVPVRISGRILQLECEGSVRNTQSRQTIARQYWVIGWTLASHAKQLD